MPKYSTSAAALAIRSAPKWIDNLLSHNILPGVPNARQGVARRLPLSVVYRIALIRELTDALHLSIASAVPLADQIIRAPDHQLQLSSSIQLSCDIPTLQQRVLESLAQAVEVTPTPNRGRPHSNTTNP